MFSDQINCRFMPKKPNDTAIYYANKGTWHGYSLPKNDDTKNYGKFGGPYCIYTNKWMGTSLLGLSLNVEKLGEIDLKTAKTININQFPGLLKQEYEFDGFKLILTLETSTTRTSLYRAIVVNTSENERKFSMNLKGSMFEGTGTSEQIPDGWVFKVEGKDNIVWLVRFRLDAQMELNYSDNQYEFKYREMQNVQANDSLIITAVVSQFFIGDSQQEVLLSNDVLTQTQNFIDNNINLWNYLFEKLETNSNINRQMILNAFQTLYQNLRSALPEKKYFTIVEDDNPNNIFLNVEQSWFTSASLLKFDPRISLNQINFIFNNMNEDGSINKFLSINDNYIENNEIIEKPFAAWISYNIYNVAPDPNFLKTILPELDKYLNYYFNNRDIDKNGWIENSEGIEDVMINAIIFSEMHSMLKFYEKTNDFAKIEYYSQQVDRIAYTFNDKFFNLETNKYCNYDPVKKEYIDAEDATAYCLWSGIASQSIADLYAYQVADKINSDEIYYKTINSEIDPAYIYILASGFKQFGYHQIYDALKEILTQNVNYNFTNKNKLFLHKHNSKLAEKSSIMAAIYLLLTNY